MIVNAIILCYISERCPLRKFRNTLLCHKQLYPKSGVPQGCGHYGSPPEPWYGMIACVQLVSLDAHILLIDAVPGTSVSRPTASGLTSWALAVLPCLA